MKKNNALKYLGLTVTLVASAIAGMVGGFAALGGFNPEKPQSSLPQTLTAQMPERQAATADENAKISNSTLMVYEYYYPADGSVEITQELPPYYLLDKSREDIITAFTGWEVKSFGPYEVVLRKTVTGKPEQYILGIKDGYVAVFYREPTTAATLKEITGTPIGSLDESEVLKLKAGIYVDGKEQLIRALENYTS